MTPTLERARRAGACFGHATLAVIDRGLDLDVAECVVCGKARLAALIEDPFWAFDADCELFEKAKEQAL